MFWLTSLVWAQEPLDLSRVLDSDFQREFVGVLQIRHKEKLVYQYAKGDTVTGTTIDAQSLLPVSSLTSHMIDLVLGKQSS